MQMVLANIRISKQCFNFSFDILEMYFEIAYDLGLVKDDIELKVKTSIFLWV